MGSMQDEAKVIFFFFFDKSGDLPKHTKNYVLSCVETHLICLQHFKKNME